jgi:hypothetical protein
MGPVTKKAWLACLAPTLLLLAVVVFPLARGSDTLYLRDIVATHLPMKAAEAEALRQGRLPLIDPYRALGQPLAGNPNAVPLYPDNLLYLVGPTLWALNAHFWLHWLLAGPAMFALGRAWGLTRRGASAAGVLWATSGYFLSQLNFYNLIAGVALAPAFVAASLCATAGAGPARRWAAGAGLLWALLLLAGDPMTALLAFVLAVGAVVARASTHAFGASEGGGTRRREGPSAAAVGLRSGLPRLGLGLTLGTLLASPQLVEFARALAGSFRALYGYSLSAATAASWDPRQALEWLLPFPFGRLDLLAAGSFWGHAFHGGNPPFFPALYPGLLALALVAAAGGFSGPLRRWAWGAAALGVFFALGRHNPAAAWLFALPGLRYPVKLWLLPAMGLAVLSGLGFERAFGLGEPRARRRMVGVLAGLGVLLLGAWGALALLDGAAFGLLRGLIPASRPDAFVDAERLRLAGLCRASAGIAAALVLAAWAARLRAAWAAALLALHSASQLVLLAPLFATDAALPYRLPTPLLAQVPEQAVLVHGGFGGLFGPGTLAAGRFPEPRSHWLARRAFFELYPPTGPLWGRRYAFNGSPEGLDGFWSRMAQAAVRGSGDGERLRLAAASGVDLLLLDRPLAPEAGESARLVAEMPSFGHRLRVYELARRLAEAQVLGTVHRAADLDQAVRHLTDPGFDPRRQAVAAGPGPELDGPPGEVLGSDAGPEHWAGEVASPLGGLLVLRRAYLPLYRAFLDGRETRTQVANLHLLGVEVPPGRHRVEVRADRRPLLASLPPAALGALGLLLLALCGGRLER